MNSENDSLTEKLMQTNIVSLIPESVKSIAHDPTNLDVVSERESQDELNFIIVEHNVSGLTTTTDWEQWITDIHAAKKAQEGSIIKIIPEPQNHVNRLHARLRNLIENKKLSLDDRILLMCRLRIKKEGDLNMLYVGEFDGEIGQGIATDFYNNTLPKLAKELNIRFIVGQNNAKNIDFFTKKLGRYTLEQLIPEWQKKLFPDVSSEIYQYITVQLLYSEDVDIYVDHKRTNNIQTDIRTNN